MVSDVEQDDVVLERPGSEYGYLGRDGEGYHHHVDEATDTVYVTTDKYERVLPEGAGLYWFRVAGDVDHVEDLDRYDDRGLAEWVQYVDAARGWDDRPADLVAVVGEAIAESGDRGVVGGVQR